MNRAELLLELCQRIDAKRIAEIGIFEGDTSYYILTNYNNAAHCLDDYYLVDKDLKPGVRSRLVSSICKIIEKTSVEASEDVEDGSLDLVFIDADHSYEAVKEDIEAWSPKVRNGGIICGHDYRNSKFPGVKKAVDELLGKGIEVIRCSEQENYMFVFTKGQ